VIKKKTRKAVSRQPSAADSLAKMLAKAFGDEVLWTYQTRQNAMDIDVIPSGVLSLDYIVGIGGAPRGRIVQLYGPESGGKTTACYAYVRAVQKIGGIVVYVDTENSIDLSYMEQAGVDRKKLIIAQPDYGEQALTLIEQVIESKKADLVVLDSVAELVPLAELEGEMTDQQIGLQARIVAKGIRKITPLMRGSKTIWLCTNQVRDKISMGRPIFGSPESTPGGRALKHASSIMISVRRGKPIKVGSKEIGFQSNMRVTKNKVGVPFRQIGVPIIYGKGIDPEMDWAMLAMRAKALRKRGGLIYFRRKVLGAGLLSAYAKVMKSVRLTEIIQSKINAMFERWNEVGMEKEDAQD